MIRAVCGILVVAIKRLAMHLYNSNLHLGKSAIRFEPLAQKGETGKQMAGALYYQY